MMPSLFTGAAPYTWFQTWFIVYVYLLPVLLWASWASLCAMDWYEAPAGERNAWSLASVIVLPLVGGAWYLLARARRLSRPMRFATVIGGAIVWLIPFAIAFWLVVRLSAPKRSLRYIDGDIAMNPSTPALPGVLQMLLGLYGYLLPMLLYVVWSTLALWDLGRGAPRRTGVVWGWVLAIFLLPFIGPVVYFIAGGSAIPARSRVITVGGGAAIYAAVLLIGAAAGGIT